MGIEIARVLRRGGGGLTGVVVCALGHARVTVRFCRRALWAPAITVSLADNNSAFHEGRTDVC